MYMFSHIPNKSLFNLKLLCFYCYCPFVIHFPLLPAHSAAVAVDIFRMWLYAFCWNVWTHTHTNFLYKVLTFVCVCRSVTLEAPVFSSFASINDCSWKNEILYKWIVTRTHTNTHTSFSCKSIALLTRWSDKEWIKRKKIGHSLFLSFPHPM